MNLGRENSCCLYSKSQIRGPDYRFVSCCFCFICGPHLSASLPDSHTLSFSLSLSPSSVRGGVGSQALRRDEHTRGTDRHHHVRLLFEVLCVFECLLFFGFCAESEFFKYLPVFFVLRGWFFLCGKPFHHWPLPFFSFAIIILISFARWSIFPWLSLIVSHPPPTPQIWL